MHFTALAMIPGLSAEQRRAIQEMGLPVPLYDAAARAGYVLMPARILPVAAGGFIASLSGFAGTGEGATGEEAMLALGVHLRGAMRRAGEV